MRPKLTTEPILTAIEREQVRLLLGAVPANADEAHPAFIELLDSWKACRVPWDAMPTVPAYRALSGHWLIAGGGEVIAAIRSAVG